MKPWQKIALTLTLSLAALSAILVVGLFSLLPDPAAVGSHLNRSSSRPTPKPATSDNAKVAAVEKFSPEPDRAASARGGDDRDARKKRISQKFLERYFTEDRLQSRVCENLESPIQPFQNVDEFGSQIEMALLGEARPSPSAEAVMLPIAYTLKNEAVRELVDTAKSAADRGETGFLQKAQFYAQAARATASVLSSQAEFESISADAYLLYTLSRAVALKPSILEDADLADFCRGIERSAIYGLARDTDFDRGRMQRLLSRHDITNAAVGYDPQISMRLSIVNSKGGLQIKMPWLDAIFQNSSKASR